MRFAYADPPYLGSAKRYKDHPEHAKWDTIEAHADLIASLERDFPDGWALSMSSVNLWDLLPLCPRPPRGRIGYWLKPFAAWKPNVNPAYAYEPIVFAGGRKRGRDVDTIRDWCMANITLKRGLCGVKPEAAAHWMFDFLGAEPDDEIVDLFPGSGAVGRAWETWKAAHASRDDLLAGVRAGEKA